MLWASPQVAAAGLAPAAPSLRLTPAAPVSQASRKPDAAVAGLLPSAAALAAGAGLLPLVAAERRRRLGRGARATFGVRPAPRAAGVGVAAAASSIEAGTFLWRGQRTGYQAAGPPDGDPVVLIHGFGVSSGTYRKTLPALAAAGYRAYAVDLLGFGASAKAVNVDYSTQLWAEQVSDFCDEFHPEKPVVIAGNSIGGLVSLITAASYWGRELRRVKRVVLLNCGAGMNSKFLATSQLIPLPFRIFSALLFTVFDALAGVRSLAENGFNGLANAEKISEVLKTAYVNTDNVDGELVEGILGPAFDEGALDVFLKTLTGDPGPPPDEVLPKVNCPVRIIWGDTDPITPLDGEYSYYGRYFRDAAEDPKQPQISLVVVNAGHVPQDDNPEAVHAALIPWLGQEIPGRPAGTGEEEEEGIDLDDLVL